MDVRHGGLKRALANVIVVCNLLFMASLGLPGGALSATFPGLTTSSLPSPSFGSVSMIGKQNVSAVIGQTAFLSCVVHNLGKDKSVTWIRHRDVHILTVGEYRYTSDQRFSTRHNAVTHEWTLAIRFVEERDAGVYECQIPKEKPMAATFQLNVIVPHVMIRGNRDVYAHQGGSLTLTCVVSSIPSSVVNFVFWYRNDEVVAYESQAVIPSSKKPRVQVRMERGERELVSRLRIGSVETSDSGNYTCKPSVNGQDSVKVHIVETESPGALQESSSTTLDKTRMWLFLFTSALARLSLC